jgi:hypothetical protein
MSTIKNSRKTVTLATANTTITGTIDAYGAVATYTLGNAPTTLEAAIFGPRGKHFTLTNTGLIESAATSATDAGILLAAPGRITNKGTIIAATGVEMLGTHARDGGEIVNKGVIEATLGAAIYLQTYGDVTNTKTGTINAAQTGIDLAAGGTIANAGLISGSDFGIYGASGTIDIINSSSGSIEGEQAGIYLRKPGAIINDGLIEASGSVLIGGSVTATASAIRLAFPGSFTNIGTVRAEYGDGVNATYGYVKNAAHATITAGNIAIANANHIINDGVVIGGSFAVSLVNGEGGYIYNAGIMAGGISLGSGHIVNDGTISVQGTRRDAIAGVDAVIYNNGIVSANFVAIYDARGIIQNTGTLMSTSPEGAGISDFFGGQIVNEKGGVVVGDDAGAALWLSETENFGLIDGTTIGIYMAGGYLNNAGIIVGGVVATQPYPSAIVATTIVDSGVILGNARYAISFSPILNHVAPPDLLLLEPGAQITGSIDLNGAPFDIRNAASQTVLTADQLAGAGELTVNANGDLDLSGYTIGGAIDNAGAITVAASGALAIDGSFQTPGDIAFAANATLILNPTGHPDGTIAQAIDIADGFTAANSAGPTDYAGAIEDFTQGDTIDLTGVSLASVTAVAFADGVLTITDTAGQYQLTFANPSSFAATFALSADGDGTAITLSPATPTILTPPDKTQTETALPALSAAYTTTPRLTPANAQLATLSPPPQGIAAALLTALTPPIPLITLHPTS